MTQAASTDIADAIVRELIDQAALFAPLAFTPERLYTERLAFEDLKDLEVRVIPDGTPVIESLTRHGNASLLKYDTQTAIVLYAKLPDLSNASIDPYTLLAQQITERFGKEEKLTHYQAYPVKCSISPPEQDFLQQYSVLAMAVTLVTRIGR